MAETTQTRRADTQTGQGAPVDAQSCNVVTTHATQSQMQQIQVRCVYLSIG